MFDQTVQRIGFACKIQSSPGVAAKGLNTGTTTISWLNAQTKDKASQRLWDILEKNTKAVYEQIQWVGRKPANQRMFRISSDLLPAYTHDDWAWWYWQPDVVRELEKRFGDIGRLARELDVRVSFHPGQFCVLASESEEIVERSIQEFEYHCDIIRYMGFGREFQDFKCNVHIGGKQGPAGIKRAMRKLSREARNCLTIENAEFTWGLEHSLELVDTCALVLDIHHHWIHTGEYIEPNDSRIRQLQDSWRGCRPVIHYSVSREDVLDGFPTDTRPDLQDCLRQGFTRAKLRAHSDFYWNDACNRWALSHNTWADIMCESKEKNLASQQLASSI
jgi:UV DNA damage endonuclease